MYSGISFSDQRTSMHKKSANTFTPTAASTAAVNDARPVLQRNHSLCQYLSVYLSIHISICLFRDAYKPKSNTGMSQKQVMPKSEDLSSSLEINAIWTFDIFERSTCYAFITDFSTSTDYSID